MEHPRHSRLLKLENQLYYSGKNRDRVVSTQQFASVSSPQSTITRRISDRSSTQTLNFFNSLRTPKSIISNLTHQIYNSTSKPVPFPLELLLSTGNQSNAEFKKKISCSIKLPKIRVHSPNAIGSYMSDQETEKSVIRSVENRFQSYINESTSSKLKDTDKAVICNEISKSCKNLLINNRKSKRQMIRKVKSINKRINDCRDFSEMIEKSNRRVTYYLTQQAIRDTKKLINCN